MMPSIVTLLARFCNARKVYGSGCAGADHHALSADDLTCRVLGGACKCHDRFVPGAAMPIMFNFCMIGGALVIFFVWRTWG